MSAILDSLINAAKRADYYRTGESGLLYEAAQRLTQADIDTAHAVALEREAIATFIELHIAQGAMVHLTEMLSNGRRVLTWEAQVLDYSPEEMVEAIRDGAHNAHTPQKRAGTGQGEVHGANAGTSDSGDSDGPTGAETRGHHE